MTPVSQEVESGLDSDADFFIMLHFWCLFGPDVRPCSFTGGTCTGNVRAFHQVGHSHVTVRRQKKELFFQGSLDPGRSARIALILSPIEKACNSESKYMSEIFSNSEYFF